MKTFLKLLALAGATVFAGAAFAALAAASAYMFVAESLPDVETLKSVRLEAPMRVYSRDGVLIGEFGEKRRVPVTYEQLPQRVIDAFVAAEDDRFFEHPGVDYQGLVRAVIVLARTGRGSQGGSTITMQVARNYLLSLRHSYIRKVREIFVALNMERVLTKQEILSLYLNKIFFGQRAYGVAAAAEVYFGKSLHELRLDEIAILAGIPKAPSEANPVTSPRRSRERRDYVLRRMRELGYIDEGAYREAVARPIEASLHGPRVQGEAAYLAELVRAEMVERYGESVYGSGLRVTTTLDADRQAAAVAALREALLAYDRRHGYRGPLDQRDVTALIGHPAQLDALLGEYPPVPLHALAVVLSADEEAARIHVADAGPGIIRLAGVRWARPWIDESRAGARPARVDEVLAAGDVIYVQSPADGADADQADADGADADGADAGDADVGDADAGQGPGVDKDAGIAEVAAADVARPWRLGQAPAVQGAIVSLDPLDGAVVAMVGGYDFRLSKFNRATQARRQPGSSFKPFIYSAALENGFTVASVVDDAPVVYDDPGSEDVWRPENYEREFRGPMRLREALVASRNLVSIRVLREVGVAPAIEHLQRFGFDAAELPRGLSLALGSASVTPWQMASAYAVLANGGFEVSSYFIDRIEDPSGQVLYESTPTIACPACERALELAAQADTPAVPGVAARTDTAGTDAAAATRLDASTGDRAPAAGNGSPEEGGADDGAAAACRRDERFLGGYPLDAMARRVIAPENVFLVTDMMRDVVQRGTGRRAGRELGRQDLAGKTGTTNEQRDAWFSGFNADLTATVWVGFDDFERLGRGEVGGRAALPAWIDYMGAALDGRPEHVLDQPYGLVRVKISPDTGQIAGADDADWIFEWFRVGNAPEAVAAQAVAPIDEEQDEEQEGETLF